MFAVIKTGGKQYRVATGDTITVERLPGEAGEVVAFEQVLMLVDGASTNIGAPAVEGVTVAGELVEQPRGAKVIAFKKRRRKNSRRKRGHRQHLSVVRITDILTGGAKPALKAKPVEAKPVAVEPAPRAKRAQAAPAQASPAAAPTKPAAPAPETKVAPEAKAAPAVEHAHAQIAEHAAAGVAAAKAQGVDTNKFQHLEKPIGKADDLKLISGVGPTIAKKLNAIGIWHYWQVKALSEEDIAKVEEQVGFKGRAHRDDWMGQAGDLMAGKGPRPKAHHPAHDEEH
jgi:large subunit ribosomal protein L21